MREKPPVRVDVKRGAAKRAKAASPADGAISPRAARAQLALILASPLFNRSDRYPAFLNYVVESVLRNPAQRIKEQTVGIEVFGRAAGYDTDRDHIVRSTAVEIRKRLRQYYAQPEHSLELIIDLPVGSYTPHFLKKDQLIAASRVQAPSTAPL